MALPLAGWLVVLGFNATLTAKVIIMAVGDAHVFPGFLTPVLTQLFFPKPPTTFLTCFCRGERRKYAGKKSRLNRGSNSQPPGLESDTLTTEPPGWACPWQHRKVSPNRNTHVKYESSIPNHSKVMAKVILFCGQMDQRTNRLTNRAKTICPRSINTGA